MDYIEKARRVFELEMHEVQRLYGRLNGAFSAAIETVLESIQNRGKVVVIGVGKSGHIGEKIAATLTSTGSPAVVLNSLNALHGDLGMVADGDTILALSYSGETDELLNILPALARFSVKIVSMTGNPESLLAQSSHVHLDVNVEHEACPLNLAPTSSTTAMLVLGDAIAMVLLEARGFKKEDFARFHPGGRLGRSLLVKVREIMRGRDRMALVSPGTLVHHALSQMTQRRTGAAVVAGEDGAIAGIFTDSDFVRHFQKNPALGDKPVSDYMTPDPITINGDRLAVEVLNVLERNRIDDLVVVDDDNRPIGIVDSQDLTKHKLL